MTNVTVNDSYITYQQPRAVIVCRLPYTNIYNTTNRHRMDRYRRSVEGRVHDLVWREPLMDSVSVGVLVGCWLTVKWRVPLFRWSEKGRRGVSRGVWGTKVIVRPCVTCSSINVASYVGYEQETESSRVCISAAWKPEC